MFLDADAVSEPLERVGLVDEGERHVAVEVGAAGAVP